MFKDIGNPLNITFLLNYMHTVQVFQQTLLRYIIYKQRSILINSIY